MHALTGCDTTSGFVGRGKRAGFKLAQTEKYQTGLELLGKEFDSSEELQLKWEEFDCALYGRADYSRVDKLHYYMFSTKACHTSQLPPCKSSLKLHVMRANYQSVI